MAERQPDVTESLVTAVERCIKSCKAEQAKINNTIQLYRELLQTLTPQPETEGSDCADDAATDTDILQEEREDIELLERALEKALQVRTGTEPSKKDPERHHVLAQLKEPATKQTSAVSKVNHTTRLMSKSAGLDRKGYKKPGMSLSSSKASVKVQQGASASGSLCHGQFHTSSLHDKKQTIRSDNLSKVGKAVTMSAPSSNNPVSVSHAGESEAPRMPQKNGVACDQIAKWKSLQSKQNRLWDKVVAVQRKPVPGRSRFMERMRATFPEDWPCSCPDQTRAQVNRLTHRGLDLMQQCHIKELLAKQDTEAATTELGGKKKKYDSSLTQEKMQMMAAELRNCADQAKEEWEAWDRWRPEGGCLCPSEESGLWGDVIIAPLPPTVTYTSEAELRELEKLRTRVALLQQDINLEQALLDSLTPQLLPTIPGPVCPDISMLRDMYSLLGEGGERFPSIVLDSEPD